MTGSRRVLASGAVVRVWTPAGRPRAMVQLQHGFAEYHRFIPRLLEHGYQVWGMDLLGHGRSPGRRAVTDARAAVRDHAAVRRQMRAARLPILLFGHSFGGLVTAGSVLEDPAGVAGVVLTGPVLLSPTPWGLRRLAGALSRLGPAAAVPLPGAPAGALAHDPDVVARARRDTLLDQGNATMRVGATALDVAARIWRDAPAWPVPLTIFHGTGDAATDAGRSRRFISQVGRPTARFRLMAGGYHELLHDHPEDDRVADEIIALFAAWAAA